MNKYKVSITALYVAEDEEHAVEQFYNEHEVSPLHVVVNEAKHVCLTCDHTINEHALDDEASCQVPDCPCETLHFNVGDCTPKCWGAE